MKLLKRLKNHTILTPLLLGFLFSAEAKEISLKKDNLALEPIKFDNDWNLLKIAHSRTPMSEDFLGSDFFATKLNYLKLEKLSVKNEWMNNFLQRRKNRASLQTFELSINFNTKFSGYYLIKFPDVYLKNNNFLKTDYIKKCYEKVNEEADISLIKFKTKVNQPIEFGHKFTYPLKHHKITSSSISLDNSSYIKLNYEKPRYTNSFIPKFSFAIAETKLIDPTTYNRPKSIAPNFLTTKKSKTFIEIKCELDQALVRQNQLAYIEHSFFKHPSNLVKAESTPIIKNKHLPFSKSVDVKKTDVKSSENTYQLSSSGYANKAIFKEDAQLKISKFYIDPRVEKSPIVLDKNYCFIRQLSFEKKVFEFIYQEPLPLKKSYTPKYFVNNKIPKNNYYSPITIKHDLNQATYKHYKTQHSLQIGSPNIKTVNLDSRINTRYSFSPYPLQNSQRSIQYTDFKSLNNKTALSYFSHLKLPESTSFSDYGIRKQIIVKNLIPRIEILKEDFSDENTPIFFTISLNQKDEFKPSFTLLKEGEKKEKNNYLKDLWAKTKEGIFDDTNKNYRHKKAPFKVESKGYELKKVINTTHEKAHLARVTRLFDEEKFQRKVDLLPSPKKKLTFLAKFNDTNIQIKETPLKAPFKKIEDKNVKYKVKDADNSKPDLLNFTNVELGSKGFFAFHLEKAPLDELISFLPKKAVDGKIGFIKSFRVEEAITFAYKEVFNKGKLPIEFVKETNFELPKKIYHYIQIQNNSKNSKSIYSSAIIHHNGLKNSKEGVFPKKQHLKSPTSSTLVNCISLDKKIKEPIFTSSKIDDLESLAIPNSMSARLNSDLVEKKTIKASFLPTLNCDNTLVQLAEIPSFSSRASIIDETHYINKINRLTGKFLNEMPSLDDLNTFNLSNEFKVDSFQIKKMDGSGFAFELNLSSVQGNILDPMENKIYFVLDRGNGIENHRFQSFKSAVNQALGWVPDSASFNIYAFDNEFVKLSNQDLKATKSSIKYVAKSLEKLGQKWSSSFAGFISVIEQINKEVEQSSTPARVIVLSNGQFLKNIRFNREALCKLMANLGPNISISTASISDNNNLQMLELISKLGKGEFLHSQTHASFPRKLAQLTKRIQNPLITDIRIQLLNSSSNAEIAENPNLTPFIYADKPFSIYGSSKKLEPLDLFIQGKSGDKWIQMIKKIDLSASERHKSVDKDLIQRIALDHVVKFILTNDQKELLKARELVRPFDIKWL